VGARLSTPHKGFIEKNLLGLDYRSVDDLKAALDALS